MPAVLAALGYREAVVNPGTVFTSKTIGLPLFIIISTLPNPLQPIASYAESAASWAFLVNDFAILAGQISSVNLASYLASRSKNSFLGTISISGSALGLSFPRIAQVTSVPSKYSSTRTGFE